jgi:hypothetical protein
VSSTPRTVPDCFAFPTTSLRWGVNRVFGQNGGVRAAWPLVSVLSGVAPSVSEHQSAGGGNCYHRPDAANFQSVAHSAFSRSDLTPQGPTTGPVAVMHATPASLDPTTLSNSRIGVQISEPYPTAPGRRSRQLTAHVVRNYKVSLQHDLIDGRLYSRPIDHNIMKVFDGVPGTSRGRVAKGCASTQGVAWEVDFARCAKQLRIPVNVITESGKVITES